MCVSWADKAVVVCVCANIYIQNCLEFSTLFWLWSALLILSEGARTNADYVIFKYTWNSDIICLISSYFHLFSYMPQTLLKLHDRNYTEAHIFMYLFLTFHYAEDNSLCHTNC